MIAKGFHRDTFVVPNDDLQKGIRPAGPAPVGGQTSSDLSVRGLGRQGTVPWPTPNELAGGSGVVMPRARRKPTPAVFYGYPVELIQQWCGVARQTAYLYKIGARKPSKQALRLFVLHRDRRVLAESWDGWCVKKDRLVDPDGNETSQGQLRAYWMVVQLAHELAREAGRVDEYYQLLKLA